MAGDDLDRGVGSIGKKGDHGLKLKTGNQSNLIFVGNLLKGRVLND
jgi:hypothetical protein